MLGNGRAECYCYDGVTRLGHIRGKMRKKVWVSAGDIVLVGKRDYQDDKVSETFRSSLSYRTLKSYVTEQMLTARVARVQRNSYRSPCALSAEGQTWGCVHNIPDQTVGRSVLSLHAWLAGCLPTYPPLPRHTVTRVRGDIHTHTP